MQTMSDYDANRDAKADANPMQTGMQNMPNPACKTPKTTHPNSKGNSKGITLSHSLIQKGTKPNLNQPDRSTSLEAGTPTGASPSTDSLDFLKEERHRQDVVARLRTSGIPKVFADCEIVHPKVADWARCYGPDARTGLILIGSCGLHKSADAAAALRRCARFCSVRFAGQQDILADIRSTFDTGEREDDAMARYCSVGVLVIDDIGKGTLKAWAVEMLYRIVNARYESCLPTIVTSNYGGAHLRRRLAAAGDETAASAIVSRLAAMCTPVTYTGRDGRLDLLKAGA